MNEDTGVHYLTPWKINETIEGLGGIGEIIEIHGIWMYYIVKKKFLLKNKHKFDITFGFFWRKCFGFE